MKNKKGNTAVIAIIIMIVVITTSVIVWLVIIKSQTQTQAQTQQASPTKIYSGSKEIINELTSKAMQIDSFAQDYIVNGKTIKRMYFQFAKEGKSFYRFRSDYKANGKEFINFINLDGRYDYEFYPEDNIAYRIKKSPDSWNETNYDKAKRWHFNYDGMTVIGEDVVNGKECYILESSDGSKMCIWKEHGVQLDLRFNQDGIDGVMYYDNFEFNLDDNLFKIPEKVKVVDKR